MYPLEGLVENVNLKTAKIELERKKREDPKFGDLKSSTLGGAGTFFNKMANAKIIEDEEEVQEKLKRQKFLKKRADSQLFAKLIFLAFSFNESELHSMFMNFYNEIDQD